MNVISFSFNKDSVYTYKVTLNVLKHLKLSKELKQGKRKMVLLGEKQGDFVDFQADSFISKREKGTCGFN